MDLSDKRLGKNGYHNFLEGFKSADGAICTFKREQRDIEKKAESLLAPPF